MKYAMYGWCEDAILISGSRRAIYKRLKRKPKRKGAESGKPNCSFFFKALKAYEAAGLLHPRGDGIVLRVPSAYIDRSQCVVRRQISAGLAEPLAEMDRLFRKDEQEWLYQFGEHDCKAFLIEHRGRDHETADFILNKIAGKMGVSLSSLQGARSEKAVEPPTYWEVKPFGTSTPSAWQQDYADLEAEARCLDLTARRFVEKYHGISADDFVRQRYSVSLQEFRAAVDAAEATASPSFEEEPDF